jgi:hypothetical protein
MNADEKILQALDDLQADVQVQGEQLATLQDDVTTIKTVTGKIPAIEQRLEHHGTLLTGLTASMATVLEEQLRPAQRYPGAPYGSACVQRRSEG